MRATVGNDVIDLRSPRIVGRAEDERFVAKILADSELETVRSAADPNLALWRCWAAKEAAYKIVSKLRGKPPVFAHRRFVLRGGEVEYEGSRYAITFVTTDASLHGFARTRTGVGEVLARDVPLDRDGAPWHGPLEQLVKRMTPAEADAVHSMASAAVRIGARADLATALDVAERRLQIVCAPGVTGWRPPQVLLDGDPAPADVSLSHDGNRIAWAILLSESGADS